MAETGNFKTALAALLVQVAAMEAAAPGAANELKATPEWLHEQSWGRRARHGTSLPRHMKKLRDIATTLDKMAAHWP